MSKLTNSITTSISILALALVTSPKVNSAMVVTTSCSHVAGTYTCKMIYTDTGGGGGGSNYDYTAQYYNNYQAHIDVHNYDEIPQVSLEELEGNLESQFNKTPWSQEEIQDLIAAVANVKLLLNYIIANYELTEDMIAKLNKALAQGAALIVAINSGSQITSHLINQEWGYAGSEIAVVLASMVITAGGTALAASTGSVILGTGLVIVAGIVALPLLEKYADGLLEQYNHEGLLENINVNFDIPNIYNYANDAIDDLFCSMLPPYKQRSFPECLIEPIVIDID